MRLTEEQKNFYKSNGYIKVSGIFSDTEMVSISEEYNHIFFTKNSDSNMEATWKGDEMKAYTNISVKAVHNLQYHSAVFSELIRKPELLDVFEDIMNSKNILLHHTKAHLKPPENGAPFLMHQDYHYFPFKEHSMVAAFLNIDDSTPENGGLCVYPGSHKLGPQKDHGPNSSYHYVDQHMFPLENASPISANRGDVIIFSYLLIHGSYLNLSTKPRRMFLIQVYAAEDEADSSSQNRLGQGWVLRGRNDKRPAILAKRFEQ